MNTRNFESGTTLRTTATFNPMDNRCKTDLRGACIDFFSQNKVLHISGFCMR